MFTLFNLQGALGDFHRVFCLLRDSLHIIQRHYPFVNTFFQFSLHFDSFVIIVFLVTISPRFSWYLYTISRSVLPNIVASSYSAILIQQSQDTEAASPAGPPPATITSYKFSITTVQPDPDWVSAFPHRVSSWPDRPDRREHEQTGRPEPFAAVPQRFCLHYQRLLRSPRSCRLD